MSDPGGQLVWDVLSRSARDEEGFPAVAPGALGAGFLRELSELAEAVVGVDNWGRLGLWADAGARLLVVLRSRPGRSERQGWPPPLRPSETPDVVLDLAELLGRRTGHVIHVGPAHLARRDARPWAGWVLPLLVTGTVPEEARFDEELRLDLVRTLERMSQAWLAGPTAEPDEPFWDAVEGAGLDLFLLDGGATLLGDPGRPSAHDAMFRHAVTELLDAGLGSGIGVLRVAQAARVVLEGRGSILAAAIQPGAYEVPLTGARRWARRLARDVAG